MRLPLEGLRVVSLAGQYPGPYATLLMADMGAEVILVEHPSGGDPARQFSGFHAALNRNKKSVTADLKTPAGRATLERLLDGADILLEGFRPGVMERLGFGQQDVLQRYPSLIYVSISGFGQTGPYSQRPAHDLSYQALAGMLFDQVRKGGQNAVSEVAIGDLSAGLFATVGALAALNARHHTGQGTYIDVSMTDGLASLMTVMLGPILNGIAPSIISLEPAYGVFKCADGRFLTLSIAHEDVFWNSLCEVLGLQKAVGLRHQERVRESKQLRAAIAEVLSERNMQEWGEDFDQADIPWAPVNDLHEVIADPHFKTRELFQALNGSDGQPVWHVAQPLVFNGERPGPVSDVPALGEHNDSFEH